jgi:hypothetical protein
MSCNLEAVKIEKLESLQIWLPRVGARASHGGNGKLSVAVSVGNKPLSCLLWMASTGGSLCLEFNIGTTECVQVSKAGRLTYHGEKTSFPLTLTTSLKERIHEAGCIVDDLGAQRSPIPGSGIQSLAIGKVSFLDSAQLLHHRRVVDQQVDLRV